MAWYFQGINPSSCEWTLQCHLKSQAQSSCSPHIPREKSCWPAAVLLVPISPYLRLAAQEGPAFPIEALPDCCSRPSSQ